MKRFCLRSVSGVVWLLILGCTFFGVSVVSAKDESGVQVIPIKVVGGRIYVFSRFIFPNGETSYFSLELSLESPEVIRLGFGTAGLIVMAPNAPPPVVRQKILEFRPAYDLVLGDVAFKIPGKELLDVESQEKGAEHLERARKYSRELEEMGTQGTLGLGFLKKYRVELNVAAGEMKLSSLDSKEPLSGDIVRTFEQREGRIWIPVTYGDSSAGKMMLGSSSLLGDAHDSYVDKAFARGLNKPAGDIGPVFLSRRGETPIDMSQHLALRPKDLSEQKTQAGTDAVVLGGVNLLQSFKLDIDWSNSRLALTRVAPAQYPQDDLEFFKAEVSANPEDLVAYLKRYPQGRRTEEAATMLLQWRLAAGASSTGEQIREAVHWLTVSVPEERRQQDAFSRIHGFMLRYPERADALVPVLEDLLAYSRGASDTTETYRIHKFIGDIYTKQGKYEQAWTHLLSASVGLTFELSAPEAALAQNSLGLLYEKQQRWFRAFVAYQKALRFLGGEVDADHVPTESELKIERIKQRWDIYLNTMANLGRVKPHLTAEDRELLGN